MIDFHKAIRAVHTDVVYICGENPENIKATDSNNKEVVVDWERVNKWVDPHAYKYQRAAEYPSMSDYLDGVVKGDQAQIDAYVAACLAVKAKYPKEQA
jgi:hypothetical protein